jgi:epoxyqueuosine reductase
MKTSTSEARGGTTAAAPATGRPERLSAAVRRRALEEGFEAVGIAPPAAIGAAGAGLFAFLAAGAHGTMDWLARVPERRAAPLALWPQARSIVAVAQNYGPKDDPMALLERRDRGVVSAYARGRDYHDVVKGRLKRLAGWLAAEHGGEARVFVDTAPLMEKPLAAAAGLGWQGKHTNLVSRQYGSWLFLGAVLTTLELAPDRPEDDHCGACRACLDICPTAAFPAPYRLDARRCIAYLTIEHRGHIDAEFRPAIGNRIFGCDDCLAVCPWNKFASAAREARLTSRPDIAAMPLADLAALDDAGFRALFAGTPVKRTGRDRFVRNVLIAIGNSGDRGLAGAARARLDDAAPVVRAMAVWALGRLLPARDFAALAARHLAGESDAGVRAEWRAEASA